MACYICITYKDECRRYRKYVRPYLKNIPGINMILPDATDEEVSEESGGKYRAFRKL